MRPNLLRLCRIGVVSALAAPVSQVLVPSANANATANATVGDTAEPSGAWSVSTVLVGSSLHHTVPGGGTETLSQPDDLTHLGGRLFTIFQNNVGPDGTASPTGNLDTTVVEFTRAGDVLGQWDVAGHADGIAADTSNGRVVVTVNEDGNSSLFTIDPEAPPAAQVRHYTYDPSPLPHGGGTDAVSFYQGQMFLSASAPSVADGPAVYEADLVGTTAHLTEVFGDQATASVASTPGAGSSTTLALTDPDSNTVVPESSPRFAGQFQLGSQGDQQQVFLADREHAGQARLQVLNLSQSVNDTAWATDPEGTLYVTQKGAGNVVAVRGPFESGSVFAAVTPCNANNAPTTCPAPGFPANYLGTENLFTGDVSPVALPAGVSVHPQGLLFVAG